MRRILVTLTLVCAMLAMPLAAASAKPLHVVTPWEIDGLDVTKDNLWGKVGVVEKLFAVKKNGDMAGRLAKSWTISDDKLTWTIELRSGIKFHDGSPLTADTAVQSLQYIFENKGVLSKAPIKKITASGPLTIKIETAKPFAALAAYLCHNSSGIVASGSFDSQGKMTKNHRYGFLYHKKNAWD